MDLNVADSGSGLWGAGSYPRVDRLLGIEKLG